MVSYAIACDVCGDRLTAGPDTAAPFEECGCGYLRLTARGETWIRDGRGDAKEPGYSVTRGLFVAVTKTEEATSARSRRAAGDATGDGGSDS